MTSLVTPARFPAKLKGLFEPYRYKVAYGGRGSAKSWSFARALLLLAAQDQKRILCAREFQNSIKQSVHTLLRDQIEELGLGYFYSVTNDLIIGINGSSFSFSGLATHTVDSIKSFEGCDICWVEEGQTVSKRSWDILIPTIRKKKSEIWVSMNPHLDTDDTYRRFIKNTPPKTFLVEMNWRDNPWFNDILEEERAHCKIVDPDGYANIWEGQPLVVAAGAIWADEYRDMLAEKRITRVPHDPVLKAHGIFDLGWNDSMAIIIAQRSASEVRVIDYIEDDHKTLDYYSDKLKRKKYNWGTLFLPHDGVAKDFKTGKSTDEILKQMGWETSIVERGSIEIGIKTARLMFPRVWMDGEKTEGLQECLKRYERKVHRETGEDMGPLHNKYSHGADAFRTLAMCVDRMRNDNVKRRENAPQAYGGWMG